MPNRLAMILVVLLIAVSASIRLPNLDFPASGWRQEQTVNTAYWLQQEPVSLFKYQTPLFGPPWRLPLEFPTYQAVSAMLASILHIDIDFACRLAAFLFFYLSAFFLYRLCRLMFDQRLISIIILLVYLWLPYNIKLSTEPLIDCAALAFALGYLYFIARWLNNPGSVVMIIAGVVFGALGYLTKITTMPIVVLPAACLIIRDMINRGFTADSLRTILVFIRKQWGYVIRLAIVIIAPLLAGYAWAIYSDHVRSASPFTNFLATKAMHSWNYGTWEQKTDYGNWMQWLTYIHSYFLPNILIILPVAALAWFYRYKERSRDFVASTIVASLMTIFVFFNLYRHDYYYVAISAFMAVVAGFGAFSLYEYFLKGKPWLIALTMIAFCFPVMWGTGEIIKHEASLIKIKSDYYKCLPFYERLRGVTAPDHLVVSVQGDWIPILLNQSRRKGLIIFEGNYIRAKPYLENMLKRNPFTTVIGDPNDYKTKDILSYWKYKLVVTPGLFKVSDQSFISPLARLIYEGGPYDPVPGGEPYNDKWISLIGTIPKNDSYVVAIEYRTEGNAAPYVIFKSDDKDHPYPLHQNLNMAPEGRKMEISFYLSKVGPNPAIILRNGAGAGMFIVTKLKIYNVSTK